MSNTSLPQRKSPRLGGYDNAGDGAYFVTVCTRLRRWLFGDVIDGQMQLGLLGALAHQHLSDLSRHSSTAIIDSFVVMPNHVHMIIVLNSGLSSPKLGQIVGHYKAGVTREARHAGYLQTGVSLWQERYHDRIVRNDRELDTIRQYIHDNPQRWSDDSLYRAD